MFKNCDEVCLIISGGHSESTAVVIGNSNFAAVAGSRINLHMDREDELRANLEALVCDLESTSDISDVAQRASKIVVVGAGAAYEKDRMRIAGILGPNLGEQGGASDADRLYVMDDTWAGLLSGNFSLYGTCVLAGTGASVYVGKGKAPSGWAGKVDGWGPIIGDYGSGFQLAVDLYRRMRREYDKSGEVPLLFRDLQELVRKDIEGPHEYFHDNLSDIESGQQWFDLLVDSEPRAWRISFAQLAAAATRAADRKDFDPLARELVSAAARDIATSIEYAVERFGSWNQNISLHGGMFEHCEYYLRKTKEFLKERLRADIFLAKHRPIVGGILLASLGDSRSPSVEEVHQLDLEIEALPLIQRKLLVRQHGEFHPIKNGHE